jgi:putative hydrolase of the HAD superfamily
MVEDDLANLKTAYKIGMKTILVSRQNKKPIFVNKRITKITQLTQSS